MSASRRAATVAVQLTFVALLAAAWYGVTAAHLVSPLFLPPPAAAWTALGRLAASGAIWAAARVTLATVVEAYAIALIGGLAAGFAIGRSRRLTRIFEPLLAGTFAIPLTLFFPLLVLFFGIGTGSKVAFGALYGFFPIVLTTIAGFGNVDELYVRASRSLGATPLQAFRHVYLPAALPVVAGGMRVGFFVCFASVLGGETLSSLAGFGHALAKAAELMESGVLYAWLIVVVLIAFALNGLVALVELRAGRRG